MKDMTVVYRLRNGRIFSGEWSIEFTFAIVHLQEGKYFFEVFVGEDCDLSDCFERNQRAFMEGLLVLQGVSEEGEYFSATQVFMNSMQPGRHMLSCECLGRVSVEKELDSHWKRLASREETPHLLHYLKLEGLRMKFSHHTQVEAYRNHEKLSWAQMQDYSWDHSVCELQVGEESYQTIFRKDSDGEVFIEFLSAKYQYRDLTYSTFEGFREDLLGILSFLNGAPVRIRCEYTGIYRSSPKLDAHIKHSYSFKKEAYRRHSEFIPLNRERFKGNNLVGRVLFYDFNRYRYWSAKLDFNSIVHLLGSAEQFRTMEERVFIQMVLLEKLSDRYAIAHPVHHPKLLDEKLFGKLREGFEGVLDDLREQLDPGRFQVLRSRLLGLNDGKRQRTDVKILLMLEGVSIPVTEEIRQVISHDRHVIIHKGDLGSGSAFFVLDNLLRKVIAKLIGYTGPICVEGMFEEGGVPNYEPSEKYRLSEG